MALTKKLHTFSSFTLSESTFWERSNKTYINDSLISTLKNVIYVVYNVKQEPQIGVQCMNIEITHLDLDM